MSKKPEAAEGHNPTDAEKKTAETLADVRTKLQQVEEQLKQAHQTIAAMQITIRVQARTLPQ